MHRNVASTTAASPVLLRVSRWSSQRQQDRFVVSDPATDMPIATVQGSGELEVDGAVSAARTAFERDWRWRPVTERSRLLTEAARVIRDHADELAQLTAVQTGMLYNEARNLDVDQCVAAFRYFGSASVVMPNAFVDGGSYHDQILAEPYGVVAVMTPTAWPLKYIGSKLAPALVAGNTVVLKPSCGSALVAIRLVELIAPIFPNGVLQLVLGPGETVGGSLVGHTGVGKLSFTGQTPVGESVLRAAADSIMPSAVQLGSRNCIIVFDDADLQQAVRTILEGAFSNHGENRTGLPRVLLQRNIRERVTTQLAQAIRRMKVGNSLSPETHIGPMSSRDRQQQALQHLARAQAEGAVVLASAAVPDSGPLRNGYFVAPVLLDRVRPDMSIVREDIPGPVACITSFNSADEAVAMANNSRYGLLAVLFTQNSARATQLSRRLEAGAVYINNYQRFGHATMPLNGTKASGYGCEEGSMETLREYTHRRVVRMPAETNTRRHWSVVDDILAS